MGSLRAKQGSYIEILKAIQAGGLQGLTRPDRLLASQVWNTLNKMEYDSTLKLYVPFDETSGSTAHDLSGNANTGTATDTTIVDGVFGKARSFDGVDDYVTAANLACITKSGTYTIEMWLYPTSAAPSSTATILENSHDTSDRNAIAITSHTPPYITFGYYDGTSWYSAAGTVSLDQWHHIAARDIAGALSIYIDDVLHAVATAPYGSGDSTKLWIGRDGGPVRDYYEGRVGGVRVYSRALSADEIYLHYLAGALKLGLI